MAENKEKPRYNAGRRIRWLGVAIIVAVIAYSGGWYWLAGQVETQASGFVEEQRQLGLAIDCADRDVRGYPFRLEIFCTSLDMERPADGLIVEAGAFRSAAQVYEPKRIYAELDAPVSVASPVFGQVEADWTLGHATATLAEPLPKLVSVAFDNLDLSFAGLQKALTATLAEAHMRTQDQELDLALRYEGLTIDPRLVDDRILPVLSGDADLRLKDGVALATQGVSTLRGVAGEIHRLALLLTPQRGFLVSGPFEIGADGLIDATLKIIIVDPAGFAAAMKPVFPEYASQIDMVASGQKQAGPDGTPELQLPINIRDGRAALGFIPLGNIPPLD